MDTKRDYEIRQAIETLREYFSQLIDLEYEQTDIADKLPFEKMKEEIAMAIYNLKSQYGKNKKEEQNRLFTICIFSPLELEFLGINYLPGSTCYVLQDNDVHILDTNHEWTKVQEKI